MNENVSSFHHLYTKVEIPAFEPRIRFTDPVLMTGSCFAEHMDVKLKRFKYTVLTNPFGILYNPVSIATSFQRIANKGFYQSEELVFHDNLFHSMDHHGSFSGPEKDAVLHSINSSIEEANAYLQKTKFAFISLGTSLVYRYKITNRIAGNNHKIPSVNFEEVKLTTEECISACHQIYQAIRKMNPDSRIIWTVSPIRHVRDGLVENQRSKATLVLAIEEILRETQDSFYFPAYEIMMDQLRDYRFYARDMIHPSDQAVDIIWEIFSKYFLDPEEVSHHDAMDKIKKAIEHRFIHQHPPSIRSFAESQLRSIDHLALQFPEMDWKEERHYFFRLIEPD